MTVFYALLDLLLLIVILGGTLPFGFLLLLQDLYHHNKASLARSLLILLTGSVVLQVGMGLFLGMLGQLKIGSVISIESLICVLCTISIVSKAKYCHHSLKVAFSALRQLDRAELFMLYSIGMIGLYLLVTLVTSPVIEFDSLWFHLPAVVRWYQTGSLTLFDPTGNWIFDHPDAIKYPYNWHILFLLCLLPFKTDVLVTLPSLLAWLMLGLSVYLLSQDLGANRFYSMAATALLLSMPFLMSRVNSAQVDLPLATIFTVSLYFAYSYHKTRSPVECFLFMASTGLLAGIKTPGIIYAALVGGFWAVLEISRRFDRQPTVVAPSRKTRFILLGWVALIFLGGFWYVHNSLATAITSNDVSSVTVASVELSSLPKPSIETILENLSKYQKSTLTSQFNPASLLHWKALISQSVSRFQLPFIALSLQIILLPYVWLRYPKSCWQRPFIAALVLFLMSGFLYWNTPYSSGTTGLEPDAQLPPLMGNNMRYGYPCIAVGTVMAAVVATVMQTPRRVVVAIVWLSGLLGLLSTTILDIMRTQVFTGQRQLGLTQVVEHIPKEPGQLVKFGSRILQEGGLYVTSLVLIYVVSSWILLQRKGLVSRTTSPLIRHLENQPLDSGAYLFRSAVVLVVLVGFLVGVGGHVRHQSQTTLYQGLYEYLEQTVGTGNKIAYFSSPRDYLLYGRQFQQTVLHRLVSPNDPNGWLAGLRREQVRFVAVGPEPKVNNQLNRVQFLQHLIEKGVLKADFGRDPSQKLVIFRVHDNGDR